MINNVAVVSEKKSYQLLGSIQNKIRRHHNKRQNYPTKLKCEVVRKKLTENLQGITCTDDRLEPMGWSALIIKEEKYKKYRVNSYNKKVKKKALFTAKAAEEDKEARNNLTKDHEIVKALWENKIINEDSLQAQMPMVKIPGQFVIDRNWTDKRTSREWALHNQEKETYAECLDIKQAGRIWLKDIFRKDCYITLKDTDDDECQE